MFYKVLILLPLVFPQISLAELKEGEVGRVAFVDGEVYVNKRKAKEGMMLKQGSSVVTKEGKTTLIFGDESVVHLDAHTRFDVTKYVHRKGAPDEAVLDLRWGRTRALVKKLKKRRKNFRFRTRSATMGVRGTHIIIESPKDRSAPISFVTVEGEAELTFKGQKGKKN